MAKYLLKRETLIPNNHGNFLDTLVVLKIIIKINDFTLKLNSKSLLFISILILSLFQCSIISSKFINVLRGVIFITFV